MVNTREQAAANALNVTRYPVRFCARFTREQFGVAALGDFDGDGAADAEDMWKAAKLRHPGDRNPPLGVPVFWGGGSSDNGHAAVTVTNSGLIRSIDRPRPGVVSTVPLAEIERAWGMPYLGWTEDLYGHPIMSEEATRLDALIAKWRVKRARLREKLANTRARRKELKKA